MQKLIDRPYYLNKLRSWKDNNDLIKIVTGIRRCGKSTLFKLFQNYLKETGVCEKQIINLNLEDARNEKFLDYKILHNHIEKLTSKHNKNYVFIDEIQLVKNYQKAINSLRLRQNIDLYVTGSNAYMFTPIVTTLLSGRYIEIKMYPLSFKEYVNYFNTKDVSISDLYNTYITNGGFPQTILLNNDRKLIQDYLIGLYNTIIQKDIILRAQFKDISRLENVVRFIFDNIGNETSIRNISNTLTSDRAQIHPQTIESYIEGLVDSFLVYKADRFDIKGKLYLKSNSKYYVSDIGLRKALLGNRNLDTGHILENIVYLELIRRGHRVNVGKVGNFEVDFIAQSPEEVIYYQVSQTLADDKTLKRELLPLQKLQDNYKKIIITTDTITQSFDGIETKNIIHFLLE
ncbi:MAG: ATP-binding protein [Endomicrobium sp.]|jgi:predicted AAA+ superfamily ATPase|nr:ATP-binding protein [Endomicrobium sp.]